MNVSRETSAAHLANGAPGSIEHVSRETSAGRRSRVGLAGLAMVALLAAACGAPPGPEGWAGAQPVTVDSQHLVLVAHKAHLYALPEGSSNANWQFPPKDKNAYPVSQETRTRITAAVDSLDLDDSAKSALHQKINDLNVAGPSATVLKDAITGSGASDDDKTKLKSLVDAAVKFDNNALNSLKALYGELGVSSDGKTVYVPTFRGMLFALDTTNGQARWIRDAGDGIVGGVAVDGDNLYFGTRGHRLFALNAKSAEQLWSVSTKGEVWATPVLDSDTLYATSLDGSLYALDRSTGEKRWAFSGAGSGIAAKPLLSGDSVYLGSFDNKLYSLKKSDGTVNWSVSADNWFWATPVVDNGVIYAASLDGKVYAVDAATGAAKWSPPFDTGAAIRSGPVIVGGGLVVAARNGKLFKLDLATGEPSEGSPILTGTKILANLTTDGDNKTVYVVPTNAALYVLDAAGALSAPGGYPLPQ